MLTSCKGREALELAKEKFEIKRTSGMPVSDEELLLDLKRVATKLSKQTVGMKEYQQTGTYSDTTVTRRFGSWNKALKAAGLDTSMEMDHLDEQLYENIFSLWSHYGRQPRRSELAEPPSQISQSPYLRRFRSWSKALESFVEYANSTDRESGASNGGSGESKNQKRPNRDPSLRLRFRVMQRDRFSCCSCGASPATQPGVELHIDHIKPWSNGGDTTLENLQTLCSRCNLGKGNLTP
jgi:hypothetical protein